jgi:hypothetical protein
MRGVVPKPPTRRIIALEPPRPFGPPLLTQEGMRIFHTTTLPTSVPLPQNDSHPHSSKSLVSPHGLLVGFHNPFRRKMPREFCHLAYAFLNQPMPHGLVH